MTRTEAAKWIGEEIYLQWWPSMNGVNTAEGKTINNYGVGKKWRLLKLTKGGMAVIYDGVHTISVPPYNINHTYIVKE